MTAERTLLHRACYVVATGFGAGRVPVAPGTAGTILAVPFYMLLRELPIGWYVVAVAALFVLGVAVCSYVERHGVEHDASIIVWDEVVGYLVTMTFAPPGWMWIVTGFVLFRLFDIWKPYPIRRIDHTVPGGFGTMIDDVLAGIYSLVVLQLLVAFLTGVPVEPVALALSAVFATN